MMMTPTMKSEDGGVKRTKGQTVQMNLGRIGVEYRHLEENLDLRIDIIELTGRDPNEPEAETGTVQCFKIIF